MRHNPTHSVCQTLWGARLGRPALVLAPMEGVTDAPMRALLSARGGFTYCVSEFLRVSQNVPPARTFLDHIPELLEGCRTPVGTPVQIQLLGGDPGRLAESALCAVELGAPGIDLNFGCPAPTVNRHDGGATLLKFPLRIREIVEAVRKAVPAELPVSAKLRLGWEKIDDIHLNAEMAAQGGASWITIHARTRAQGYAPPVFWEPIGEIRARLGIPVIANGDIWTIEDFRRCRDVTGCEHFMLGRSALADPALPLRVAHELGLPLPAQALEEGSFHPILASLATSALSTSASPGSERPSPLWLPLFDSFETECARHIGNKPGFVLARTKQWLNLARRARPLPWFDSIKRCSTMPELRSVLSELSR